MNGLPTDRSVHCRTGLSDWRPGQDEWVIWDRSVRMCFKPVSTICTVLYSTESMTFIISDDLMIKACLKLPLCWTAGCPLPRTSARGTPPCSCALRLLTPTCSADSAYILTNSTVTVFCRLLQILCKARAMLNKITVASREPSHEVMGTI